ncbi:OmpP1/FadL family transporter [Alcanivoracaceae bacterium MT1]
MKKKKVFQGAAVAAFVSMFSGVSMASMGNIATTYGLLPSDISSAQGLSLFNTQASAVYYNPAYLTKDPRGELTSGLLHAEHELRVGSRGGAAPPIRNGKVLQDSPSQHVLLGTKTDLSSMSRLNHPIYLGVMLGVEKYGEEMMAFESSTSNEGQYFEYGRQPMFLVLGGATQIWRGLDFGASARVTLHATSELRAVTTLGGKTSYEKMNVEAKPSIRPIVGLTMDWGESFCDGGGCWYDGLETAFSYRAYSNTKTTVDANTVIPGTVAEPGLSLAVTTLDSYQPDIYSLGTMYGNDRFRVGASVELQRWSALEKEFERDTIKDQAVKNGIGVLEFKDIVIPRIGAEYKLTPNYMVTGGVAYSQSPLDSDASLDVNYLDTDKIIVGLGLTAQFEDPHFFAYPVRFDLSYQYQRLRPRDFDLYATNSPSYPEPFERVEAEGDVHVFAGSVTLKF